MCHYNYAPLSVSYQFSGLGRDEQKVLVVELGGRSEKEPIFSKN
jgi:hypothetical protein